MNFREFIILAEFHSFIQLVFIEHSLGAWGISVNKKDKDTEFTVLV